MSNNPVTIPGKTPIFRIEQIFKKRKIWSLIVLDYGKPIGIVTKSDLIHRGRNKSPKTPAYAIMTRNPIIIDPDSDVEHVIRLLTKKNINGLPVVSRGKLCGIVTKYDINEKYQKKVTVLRDPPPNRYDTNNFQKISDKQNGFIKRLTEDVSDIIDDYLISPLKSSYYEDTIRFLALLAMEIGLFGISLVGISSAVWMFFFQGRYVPGGESPPLGILIILFGIPACLLVIGSMVLETKRRIQNIDRTHKPVEEVSSIDSISPHKFKIAVSFAGRNRKIVEEVAFSLRDELGKNTVFYDNFYKAQLAQPNLDLLLQKIYSQNSELNVIFLSLDYVKKEWCGIEFRAIRELIKMGQSSKIMLLRFDDVNIKGLFSIDGYLDIRTMSALEISNYILDRYRGLDPETTNKNI